jgi:hypothetical protein
MFSFLFLWMLVAVNAELTEKFQAPMEKIHPAPETPKLRVVVNQDGKLQSGVPKMMLQPSTKTSVFPQNVQGPLKGVQELLDQSLKVAARISERPRHSFEQNLSSFNISAYGRYDPKADLVTNAGNAFNRFSSWSNLSQELNATELAAFRDRFLNRMVEVTKQLGANINKESYASSGEASTADASKNRRWLRAARRAFEQTKPLISSQLVKEINNGNYGFKVKLTPSLINKTSDYIKKRTGLIIPPDYDSRRLQPWQEEELARRLAGTTTNLPSTFTPSMKWPQCASAFSRVLNQGECGSCWVFATVWALESRLCIATNATFEGEDAMLSRAIGTSCAARGDDGCQGGWPTQILDYVSNSGLPTGGSSGCAPSWDMSIQVAPQCPTKCTNGNYARNYYADLFFLVGAGQYQDVSASATVNLLVRSALYNFGPVATALYADKVLMMYSGGIYNSGCGNQPNHAVTVIGWGTNFWLIMNSWGSTWGEKGFFRAAECVLTNFIFPTGAFDAAGYPLPIPKAGGSVGASTTRSTTPSSPSPPSPSTTRSNVPARSTVDSCLCQQRWYYQGVACTTSCCNPDGSPGDWCMTTTVCNGKNWGYCSSSASTVTTTPLPSSGSRSTVNGCACKQQWQLRDAASSCNNYCCNPDNSPSDWCFTVNTCSGQNWGYCSTPATTTVTTRPSAVTTRTSFLQSTTTGAIVQRYTTSGCTCRQTWTFTGFPTCQNFCCNPDGDSAGSWCFTVGTCQGLNWGSCAPIGGVVTTTSTTPSGGVRYSVNGCACRQRWQLQGYNTPCTNYCCSPDGDVNGDWCFTDSPCSYTWGYCLPQSGQSTTSVAKTTTSPSSSRFTTSGCACMQTWTLASTNFKCTTSCCNPDRSSGDWCFTVQKCNGVNWGFCSSSSAATTTTTTRGGTVGGQFTVDGCTCQKNWQYLLYTPCTNYCCNPDGDSTGSWCYTTSQCSGRNWGYCMQAQTLPATPAPSTGTGGQMTISGCTCMQTWTLTGYNTCSNYCCNPDGDSRTWCFTTETCGRKNWDYCSASVTTSTTTRQGTPMTTINGCTCYKEWKLNGVGSPCQNYCCNPDNDPNGPWCFTTLSCKGKNYDTCSQSSNAGTTSRSTTSTTTGQVARRTTVQGCTCLSSWQLEGYPTCKNSCCNPDNDDGGVWCFTVQTCNGNNWDHCAPLNGATTRRLTTTSTTKKSTSTTKNSRDQVSVGTPWSVTKGDCVLSADGCLTSPNFVAGSTNQYTNNAYCKIAVSRRTKIKVVAFNTEPTFDFLQVAGKSYSGTQGPQDLTVNGGDIKWTSDGATTSTGWKICPQATTETTTTVTTTSTKASTTTKAATTTKSTTKVTKTTSKTTTKVTKTTSKTTTKARTSAKMTTATLRTTTTAKSTTKTRFL